MFQFMSSFPRFRIISDDKKLQRPGITPHEAVSISCYVNGNIKMAWHIISETITAAPGCGISDEIVKILLLILKNYESLFSDIECLEQLKRTMAALHKHPEYEDILAMGTLLYWETQNTAFSKAKVDGETLMKKATQCLKIWTHWFLSDGSVILKQSSDVRVMLNFRFLRTVAELAIVNFQNFTAVTSLSFVRHLADLVKRKGIVRDSSQAIVSIIPQMGLQHVSKHYILDLLKKYVFMDDLLCLTDVATHHLKTGQFHKFYMVRDAVYAQSKVLKKRCKTRPDVPFAKAVIKRLEAEFQMMPESGQIEETRASRRELPHSALYLAERSLIHIRSLYTDKFGDNFPRMTYACDALGPWKIVQEYLTILKLIGEIFQYIGLTRKAIKHLQDGLHVADKFKLVTWGTIFSSQLIEQQLILGKIELATSNLQTAQNFLMYRKPNLKPGFNHCHQQPTIDFVAVDTLACGLKMCNLQTQPNFSCQCPDNLEEDMFADLLEDIKIEIGDQQSADVHPKYLLLTDITSCCSCCQTENISVCIHLMCLQAEILWRKEKSICEVSYLLQLSLIMAQQFARMAACNNVTSFIAKSGFNVYPLSSDIASNNKTFAQTALKCAEIYFQNLYVMNHTVIFCDHVFPGIESIHKLLDIVVEVVGKKAGGLNLCNVLAASALLARNRCNYLTILKTLQDVDVPEVDTSPCRSSIFHTVNLAVSSARKEKKVWDTRRSLLVSSGNPYPLVNLPDHPSLKSLTMEPGHLSDQPSFFDQLTRFFPILAIYHNGEIATERIKFLKTALHHFQKFPHSLLHRQISQSISLCLWEKQMTSVCGSTRVTRSSQRNIAAYLTDSMHVTFQHMMTDNFVSKLSEDVIWKNQTPEQADTDEEATTEHEETDDEAIKKALEVLRFGGDVMDNFQDRLASLPSKWTVVQITVVNFDPTNPGPCQILFTRLNSALEPFTIGFPENRRKFLKIAQRSYENGGFGCHYSCLPWKREHILETLLYMQEVCLGGFKWLLRGQLDCVRQRRVQTVLQDAGKRAANILQQQGIHIHYTELRNLLEILLDANETDILSLVECIVPQHVTSTIAQICIGVQKEVTRICGELQSKKRNPVILILDNELSYFPWENMPDLISDHVTRMPSFVSLTALLTWHKKKVISPFKTGVERTSVKADICATTSRAPEICVRLKEELRQYTGWLVDCYKDNSCLMKLQPKLDNSSLYLYKGHTKPDYSDVQFVSGRAVAISLSCKTGLLTTKKNVDGNGAPLYFLLAGCPAFVGNLTVSYQPETIDLISKISSCWMAQKQPVSVRELLVTASQATGNFGTCGTRLVIYGLPVTMN